MKGATEIRLLLPDGGVVVVAAGETVLLPPGTVLVLGTDMYCWEPAAPAQGQTLGRHRRGRLPRALLFGDDEANV
jgi:hypothetical protein